jgi:hypothetical protein
MNNKELKQKLSRLESKAYKLHQNITDLIRGIKDE